MTKWERLAWSQRVSQVKWVFSRFVKKILDLKSKDTSFQAERRPQGHLMAKAYRVWYLKPPRPSGGQVIRKSWEPSSLRLVRNNRLCLGEKHLSGAWYWGCEKLKLIKVENPSAETWPEEDITALRKSLPYAAMVGRKGSQISMRETISLAFTFSLRAGQSLASQKCLGKEQSPASPVFPIALLGPDVQ